MASSLFDRATPYVAIVRGVLISVPVGLLSLAIFGAFVQGPVSAGPTTTRARAAAPSTTRPPSTTAAAPTTRSIQPSRSSSGVVLPWESFPAPPKRIPTGPVNVVTANALNRLIDGVQRGSVDPFALQTIVASKDPRHAWVLADVLRLAGASEDATTLTVAFRQLTGVDPAGDPRFSDNPWRSVANLLMVWDMPAAPGYPALKSRLFALIEAKWAPFFADQQATVDWRLISWGGVRLDDRPLGSRDICLYGCIPALDDPELTAAADGSWYPNDRFVFGVIVNGEAVAFPKNIMEVHEMVNITIGGKRLAIPYCTLCGSAQAFETQIQAGKKPLVMRTSGLLSRSNKVMFDLESRSMFDTFTGKAVSGPLRKSGVLLAQETVISAKWADWKAAHPDTKIVAEDGGIGREYELDPLHGRDANGPIFPIGGRDGRLAAQELVVGVNLPDGKAVAFPVAKARAAIISGRPVEFAGVRLSLDGGGLRAVLTDGQSIAAHEAFWFAWSQFHPGTELWPG